MGAQYWVTNAERNGTQTEIFAITTELAVEADKAASTHSGSLLPRGSNILFGSAEPPSGEQQYALAAGAFAYYFSREGFTWPTPFLRPIAEIPDGLQQRDFGGTFINGEKIYAGVIRIRPNV